MAYSIVTNVCEGAAVCAPACPVACIHPGAGANAKGTVWYWIDRDVCIDCGVCLEVCPVQGAVLPYPSAEQQPPIALH